MTLHMALTFKKISMNNNIIKHKVKVITNLNICRSQGVARGESLCMDSLRMGRILGLYIGFKTFTLFSSRYNIPILLQKGHSQISCTLQIPCPQYIVFIKTFNFFNNKMGSTTPLLILQNFKGQIITRVNHYFTTCHANVIGIITIVT